jgi:hypothetical protein
VSYFGGGGDAGPAGGLAAAGGCAGFELSSSTSKISIDPGGIGGRERMS